MPLLLRLLPLPRHHAFWKLYGIDLPDEVLKKVYYKNALKIVTGCRKGMAQIASHTR